MQKPGAWKDVLPLPAQLKLKLGPVCRHARDVPAPSAAEPANPPSA